MKAIIFSMNENINTFEDEQELIPINKKENEIKEVQPPPEIPIQTVSFCNKYLIFGIVLILVAIVSSYVFQAGYYNSSKFSQQQQSVLEISSFKHFKPNQLLQTLLTTRRDESLLLHVIGANMATQKNLIKWIKDFQLYPKSPHIKVKGSVSITQQLQHVVDKNPQLAELSSETDKCRVLLEIQLHNGVMDSRTLSWIESIVDDSNPVVHLGSDTISAAGWCVILSDLIDPVSELSEKIELASTYEDTVRICRDTYKSMWTSRFLQRIKQYIFVG